MKLGLKEPVIKETGDFVDVELYRKLIDSDGLATDFDGLATDSEENLIMNYIEKNKKISTKELKLILQIGDTKAKEVFNNMIFKGLIQRQGKGRGIYYILVVK